MMGAALDKNDEPDAGPVYNGFPDNAGQPDGI
jgi:hypothetical protein